MKHLKVLFLAIALLLAGCADIPDEEYVLGTPVAVAPQLDLPTEETAMAQNGWSKTIRMNSRTAEGRGESLQVSSTENDAPFTVQFELHILVPGGEGIMPRARISWTIGGASVTRIVSVNNGTSVSGVGTNVVISLYDAVTEYTNAMAGAGIVEYEVVVTCGKGVRGPAAIGPVLLPWVESRRIGADSLMVPGESYPFGAGAGDVYQALALIPPNSGATSFYWEFTPPVDHTTVLPSDMKFWVATSGVGGSGGIRGNADRRGTWIPLSPGATAIYFEFNPASALSKGVVTLLLGIDG